MEPNQHALQRQQNALTVPRETSLTASSQTIGLQMHLTALNSKSEPQPELVAEFDKELSQFEPEAIEWAFKAWRRKSQFFPALSEVLILIHDWQRGKAEQRAIRAKLDEQFLLEEGRKQGQVFSFPQIIQQMGTLIEKMGMPEPIKKLRDFEKWVNKKPSVIPVIAQHLTPEQINARAEKERAEIDHYAAVLRQRDEGKYAS